MLRIETQILFHTLKRVCPRHISLGGEKAQKKNALVNIPIIHTCFATVNTEAVFLTDEALGQAHALGHDLSGI